jgi:cytosol alanyl aminopeptidase
MLTMAPSSDSFEGEVQIDVDVAAPAPVVWLNASELDITYAEGISLAPASAPAGGRARLVPGGKDFVGLAFDSPLPAGRATLHLRYRGKVSSTDLDGASRQKVGGDWYIFTQFEPLAARRVFPCFDEPSFKIPWQLTLRTNKSDLALSNTPVASRDVREDGTVTTRFAETKPLPSYLVAFAVGPFGVVDAGHVGTTPVRVITPRGKEAWGRFAARTTGPVLERLEEYFGSAYPFGKLDVIAVPLFRGAMENPGLVTFRESLILSRPEQESTDFKRAYTRVCAHELAHQWFGDLVTTAWWDDLWLNEAFATWMTPKIVDALRPEWDAPSARAASASYAMRADSLLSARRVRQSIASNDDIHNAFDGITYQKGAAVIAMFERWVGPDRFQRGVRRYMREHAGGTATAADFLSALSAEAARGDVAPAFSAFLDQPGVPLIEATLACDARGARLALGQSRYLPAGHAGASDVRVQTWKTPVCARFSVNGKVERACTLVDGPTGELALAACPEWIVANDDAAGYYRTSYDGATLERLIRHIDVLAPNEKVALVGDLVALAYAARVDYTRLLELVPALARDKNVHVVDAAAGAVAAVRDTPLLPAGSHPAYAKYVRDTFGARARALGLRAKPGEDEETRWLRPTLVALVADQGEDAELRVECTRLARAWIADKKAIEPELIGTVLGVAVAFGDRALFDALVADAKTTPERVDRDRALGAIGRARAPKLVSAALDLALSADFDPRDSIAVVWGAARLPETAPAAYAFVTKNFDALVARLPRDSGAGFPGMSGALCDDARRDDVEAFFRDRAPKFTGGPRVLAQSLETMHVCSVFRAAQTAKTGAFFQTKK